MYKIQMIPYALLYLKVRQFNPPILTFISVNKKVAPCSFLFE